MTTATEKPKRTRKPSQYTTHLVPLRIHATVPSFDLTSVLDEALEGVVVTRVQGRKLKSGGFGPPTLRLDTPGSLPKAPLSEKERLELQAAKIAERLAQLA